MIGNYWLALEAYEYLSNQFNAYLLLMGKKYGVSGIMELMGKMTEAENIVIANIAEKMVDILYEFPELKV